MESVDYSDTFIAVADDSPAQNGEPPPRGAHPSVAERSFELLAEHPYELTSGDVIFTVYADRADIPAGERAAARAEFYAKPQACLRASPLGKRYGWGIHADQHGRVALYGVGTADYDAFTSGTRRTVSGEPIAVTRAMRSARPPRPPR